MSYLENQDKYFKLFFDYYNLAISAVDFERNFSTLWDADRDEIYEQCNKWERRFDIELQEKLIAGKISGEEFSKRWNELWGITDEISALSDILDRTYTTCDCFWPDITDEEANPPLELSETLFREEVLSLYHEMETFINKTHVNDI